MQILGRHGDEYRYSQHLGGGAKRKGVQGHFLDLLLSQVADQSQSSGVVEVVSDSPVLSATAVHYKFRADGLEEVILLQLEDEQILETVRSQLLPCRPILADDGEPCHSLFSSHLASPVATPVSPQPEGARPPLVPDLPLCSSRHEVLLINSPLEQH